MPTIHLAARIAPGNKNIRLIAESCLEGILVTDVIPKESAIALVTEGNAFHHGAATNPIEL